MSAAKIGRRSHRDFAHVLAAVEKQEEMRAAAWLAGRLDLLPARWSAHVGAEHRRRGGLASAAANRWALAVTEAGRGRLPLSASDDDLREAARAAAKEGADVRGGAALRALLADHCRRWGIEGPGPHIEDGPAIKRMVCGRWWLRRLRRALGRRCDAAAIAGLRRFSAWAERLV